jgi:predicted short-subunit dehydrogenase-like oxidoreductase (DUF2520 family)
VIRLVLLGTGNVAHRLFDLWRYSDTVSVIQVIGRDRSKLSHFEEFTAVSSIQEIVSDADIYLIAVSDHAIAQVSRQIKGMDKLVVHTSGALSVEALPLQTRRGVFYPLQTFSSSRPPHLQGVPVCIEAEGADDLRLLQQLGRSLSDNIIVIPSEKRKILHLSAVFANNFTNHLCHLSQELLEAEQLSPGLLLPLISETVEKLKNMSAYDAQTGPARRGDDATQEQHFYLLKNEHLRQVYKLLSTSIQKTYVEKL